MNHHNTDHLLLSCLCAAYFLAPLRAALSVSLLNAPDDWNYVLSDAVPTLWEVCLCFVRLNFNEIKSVVAVHACEGKNPKIYEIEEESRETNEQKFSNLSRRHRLRCHYATGKMLESVGEDWQGP